MAERMRKRATQLQMFQDRKSQNRPYGRMHVAAVVGASLAALGVIGKVVRDRSKNI